MNTLNKHIHTYMENVHECSYVYIYIYIGIRKHSKHWRLSGSGTKPFITFLSLRFFDMRRERHNFFNKRAAHFVDPYELRKSSTFFKRRISTNCFFSHPPNPQRFGAWRHSRPRSQFLSGVFIVTSLIVTSTPHARERQHSTNPCTN